MNNHLVRLLTLGTTVMLVGCSILPTASTTHSLESPRASNEARVPGNPSLAFVARAPAEGAARALVDPTTGKVTEVVAGRTYFAASGRECRRYSRHARPAPKQASVACRNADGSWTTQQSIINQGLKRASTGG